MSEPEHAPEATNSELRRAIAEELKRARGGSLQPRSPLPRKRRGAVRTTDLHEAEYHQARVLMLIDAFSGKSGSLDGLTKLAKLDFLLRYPVFLERLANSDAVPGLYLPADASPKQHERSAVESRMVRYKYGPWDDKYYSIVGALVGRGLVEYVPRGGGLALRPTVGGQAVAQTLSKDLAWRLTAARCEVLKKAFKRTSGNRLKDMIYSQFPEVVDLPHRTEI